MFFLNSNRVVITFSRLIFLLQFSNQDATGDVDKALSVDDSQIRMETAVSHCANKNVIAFVKFRL